MKQLESTLFLECGDSSPLFLRIPMASSRRAILSRFDPGRAYRSLRLRRVGEAIKTLGAMYLLLPVSVASIATYNGTLFGLALSFFSILMAGQRMRNGAFHMS